MSQASVYEGNAGFVLLSKFVTKASDELKAARAAAYDDDVMQIIHDKGFLK